MTSTMFIDNKAKLFLLITPMIQFRRCIKKNGVTVSYVKKGVTKHLTSAAKQKDGDEN